MFLRSIHTPTNSICRWPNKATGLFCGLCATIAITGSDEVAPRTRCDGSRVTLFPAHVLQIIAVLLCEQSGEEAILALQLLIAASLNDLAFAHDQDLIDLSKRAQAM